MPTRPHIVFSMSDDQRFDHMGCAGHPFVETPAMDRVAAEGVRFANAFTTCPLCAPSRGTCLTGKYPHSHGVVHNEADLNDGITTWPERLQKAGYRTGFFGKIHYGSEGDMGERPKPGFDRWVGWRGQGQYEDPVFFMDGERVHLEGYNTDLIAKYATDFIKAADDRPWALCLWYRATHRPFTPPERYRLAYSDVKLHRPQAFAAARTGKTTTLLDAQKYAWGLDKAPQGSVEWDEFMRDYTRTVRGIDDALGSILATLDELDMADNTLVIHTSDHGHFHGEFGLGDKRWMYDPSVRIPLIVRYPPLTGSGGVVDESLVLNIDVPATISDLALSEVPDHYHGQSLRPLLAGDGDWERESMFFEYFEDPPFPTCPTTVCLRTRTRKLIHYLREGERDELYDLEKDPHEQRNVIRDPAYASEAASLQKLLEQAMTRFDFRTSVEGLIPSS